MILMTTVLSYAYGVGSGGFRKAPLCSQRATKASTATIMAVRTTVRKRFFARMRPSGNKQYFIILYRRKTAPVKHNACAIRGEKV